MERRARDDGGARRIDEIALVAALEAGEIAGAALDVFVEEPLPEASALWGMSNVLITPHTSGIAPGLWDRAMELFAENLRRFIDGRPLKNLVDKRAGY